jgi:hypothetical protein
MTNRTYTVKEWVEDFDRSYGRVATIGLVKRAAHILILRTRICGLKYGMQ